MPALIKHYLFTGNLLSYQWITWSGREGVTCSPPASNPNPFIPRDILDYELGVRLHCKPWPDMLQSERGGDKGRQFLSSSRTSLTKLRHLCWRVFWAEKQSENWSFSVTFYISVSQWLFPTKTQTTMCQPQKFHPIKSETILEKNTHYSVPYILQNTINLL